MGIIGTGLFDDDLAADVRGEYRDLIAEGKLGLEATDILIKQNQGALANPLEEPVFWLALAAAQWECGRLEERVWNEAMRILNRGTDLARWDHDPKLLRQRRRVLERLRARLVAPQPSERRIRKRFKDSCDWDPGEVIAYRLASGQFVLFRVVLHLTDPTGTYPLCELLDWIGVDIPSEDAIKRLSVRTTEWPRDFPRGQFTIHREKADELPLDRIIRLGLKSKPSKPSAIQGMFSWKHFEEGLVRRYPGLVRGAV
jgi:hypothetical protein